MIPALLECAKVKSFFRMLPDEMPAYMHVSLVLTLVSDFCKIQSPALHLSKEALRCGHGGKLIGGAAIGCSPEPALSWAHNK